MFKALAHRYPRFRKVIVIAAVAFLIFEAWRGFAIFALVGTPMLRAANERLQHILREPYWFSIVGGLVVSATVFAAAPVLLWLGWKRFRPGKRHLR